MPAETGPLDTLARRHVLVLADVENLSLCAEKSGAVVHYRALAGRLAAKAAQLLPNAFATIDSRQENFARRLRESGWTLHSRPPVWLGKRASCGKPALLRNSDAMMLFTAGHLVTRHRPEVLLIGSGDGEMIVEMARAIRALNLGVRCIGTLSFPGALNAQARGACCPDLDFEAQIGRDVLGSLPVAAS